MLGTVEPVDLGLGIVYLDRGARYVASKKEKWVSADPPRPPMTEQERREVAGTADMCLRALDHHEPMRWWEPNRKVPHDPGLVAVILEYLEKRG